MTRALEGMMETYVVHHANGTESLIDNPSLIPRPHTPAQY